jgi:hypothetical protein
LNRARRGQLEYCRVYCSCCRTGIYRATGQYSPSKQRTTSKIGIKTIRQTATCIRSKASSIYIYTNCTAVVQALYKSASYSIGYLWYIYRVFTLRAFRQYISRELPRDPTSKKSRNYTFVQYCGQDIYIVKTLVVVRC